MKVKSQVTGFVAKLQKYRTGFNTLLTEGHIGYCKECCSVLSRVDYCLAYEKDLLYLIVCSKRILSLKQDKPTSLVLLFIWLAISGRRVFIFL